MAVRAPVPLRRTLALHRQRRTEFKRRHVPLNGQVTF
ncbi:hypothetical protein DO72_4490 [Burkholderia pseudomallei]|nr:hypothetical protein DO72_4490 [Burkholderia pseudomallei]